MSPKISKMVIFLFTAKEIWNIIRKTHSKVKDANQIYDLNIKAWSTKQENVSIIEYSNLLKGW